MSGIAAIGIQNRVRLSDVQQRTRVLLEELEAPGSPADLVEMFDGGKSGGVAGYRSLERMRSLDARFEGQDLTVGEMVNQLDRSIVFRKKACAYLGLGVALTAVGVAATGLLHMCGVDLGQVGQLAQAAAAKTTMMSSLGLPMMTKLGDAVTGGLERDRAYLEKMTTLLLADEARFSSVA